MITDGNTSTETHQKRTRLKSVDIYYTAPKQVRLISYVVEIGVRYLELNSFYYNYTHTLVEL